RDHLAVAPLGEEVLERGDDLRADALERIGLERLVPRAPLRVLLLEARLLLEQAPPVRLHQGIEATEGAREDARDLLADMADAEGEDEARQRAAARCRDRVDQALRGLLPHAIEAGEGFHVEPVEVRRAVDEVARDELLDNLLAQSVDVHRAALAEVQQRLLALRRADEPSLAAPGRLARLARGLRAADGTCARHAEFAQPLVARLPF